MKYVKSIKKNGTKTIENETKENRWGILGMLLGTLGASLLGNILTVKGAISTADWLYEFVKILLVLGKVFGAT